MSRLHFRFESTVAHPRDFVFSWHEKPGALKRLTPPWQSVKVLRAASSLSEGQQVELEMKVGPLKRRWTALHTGYQPPEFFRDEQISGPFAEFIHEHRFEEREPKACRVIDDIQYRLPFGIFGRIAGEEFCVSELKRAFGYRHRTLARDLDQIVGNPSKPLRILITGSSGLVGSQLSALLQNAGHDVEQLVRHQSSEFVSWSKAGGIQNLEKLSTYDGVIHLAGAGISSARWSDSYKKEIYESRIISTRHLVEAIRSSSRKPKFFLSASAIGFYGNCDDTTLEESNASGSGFLADVCRDWEAEAQKLSDLCRVVSMRIGIVLSPSGGALQKMLPAFRLGVAGVLGSGRQYMSWISLDDLICAIHYLATHDHISGAVNMVSPNPITNREFTSEVAKSLKRWVGPPAPAAVLKCVAGELADQLLLSSMRCVPKRLLEGGFKFRDTSVSAMLKHQLSLE